MSEHLDHKREGAPGRESAFEKQASYNLSHKGNGGNRIDFDSINARLLGDYLAILKEWFPNGKKIGPDWCVGSLAGEPGESLKIHVRKGIWADFATGDKGSDPVSLYAAIHGIPQGEAAKRLVGANQPAPVRAQTSAPPSEDELEPVLDPPEDMPDPKLPSCTVRYTYRNAEGNVLGFISRTDTEDGKKFIPRTPWYDDRGDIIWQTKAFACPRPLYGLNVLANLPAAVVVLVEGEKCVDALQACIPTTPTLTWLGGSNAIEHVDWEPLRGRQVILWPDADEPGRKCMARVAEILIARGCQVKIARPPDGASKGWDVADAIAEGWTPNQCADFLGKAERVGAEMVIARTTTTTQAIRTAEAELVQRVEVREELAESKPVLVDFGFQRGAQGRYVPCLNGVCHVLEKHSRWKGKIWYDTFLEKIQTDAFGPVENWTDYLAARLNRWIQAVFEFPTLGTERVQEAVDTVARGNTRNVLREWLEALTWDQTPRLHALLDRGFGAPRDIYHVRVGECWIISMVARVLSPGCKVDTMPVFEGSQGAGKSTALAILGGEFFGEMHEDFGSKDFVLSLKGRWLIEVAEMHAFGKTDVDRLKGIMSTRIDRIRRPYGRTTEEHPRQSVFAGTTNRDDWQQDDTGARRFWPVRCGTLNHDWLLDNREQLFAEAVARFRSGDDWWKVPAAQAAAAADERRPGDPWEEVIAAHVEDHRTCSIRELLAHPLKIETADQDMKAERRVGSILRRLGWENYTDHSGERPARRWRLKLNPSERL
jgi:putative DNA primase/helicase